MPSAPTSCSEFFDLLQKSGLLSADRLASLSDLGLPEEPPKAAAALVSKGLITRFQAQQLLAGRHRGFRIGGYLIKDMLGRGGMGAVYLAEHLELNRKVAVKVLVPGKDDDQKLALERFIREARAAAALDHPNIVRIFDVARHNEVPYLVMEYVEGETLQQVLDRDGAVPYPTATEYIAQAAAGLQHAHEKGFVHRDIKPGNLMREKGGTVKILDMGLARSANGSDNLTERLDNGAVVGTADFIAPEQALNQPNVDGRADIYSLGASFFALIIGKPPFEGNTTQKLLQHQLRSAPRLAVLDATLPKGLSAVVAKMLAKKPEDRYGTPAEVIAALAPWMGNSARILAGISRTNLAQGANLQETLSEIARGKNRRLRAEEDDSEEVDVDHSNASQETGAVASSITTRERVKKRKKKGVQDWPRKKVLTYAAVAVGVSLIGVLGAWAVFGGSKKPDDSASGDNRSRQEQEQPKPGPGPIPKQITTPNPTPPKVEAVSETSIYKFDAAEVQPFKVRLKGGNITEGKRGALPRGISLYALNADTEADFESGKVDGASALSITRQSTRTGAQVAFELERETASQGMGFKLKPETPYKVRVRYRTAGAAQLELSVHTIVGFKSVGYKVYPATAEKWAVAELPIRRDADPLRLAIAALGTPKATVAIAGVEVLELLPATNSQGERILTQLDLTGQRPFAIRSGITIDANDPNRKNYRQISKSGDGSLPAGWSARCYNKDTEMEVSAEETGGRNLLVLRNVRGPGSAMLFMPAFNCPTSACRLRVEYNTNVRDGRFAIRFKPSDSRLAWDIVRPPVSGGAWRTEELEAELKGATGGFFEFHNTDADTNTYVRIRALTVSELRGADRAEQILFKLDAAELPEFKNAKLGRAITAGDDDPRLKGVYFGGWKQETVSEWACTTVAGSKVIGYTNMNEIHSAQIGMELEQSNGVGLKFQPGQRVRLRVEYRTAGRGRGSIYFQNVEDHKVPDRAELPNSNTDWRTVDLITTRGSQPLRCLIDAGEHGAGNTLYVRTIQIMEAGKGAPPGPVTSAPPTPKGPDLSQHVEGRVLYSLDFASIPEFRVVKEQHTRTSGEPERLPAGIGCQCWKENAVGEFRCEKVDGAAALGLTNLNDEKSSQFFFGLEADLKLAFQPGKAYRVKVTYMTRNDALGDVVVHVKPGYRSIGSGKMPGSSGQWKTTTASFVRPPASDNVEIRCVIDNGSVGEGNILYFKSLEVVELTEPPAKK